MYKIAAYLKRAMPMLVMDPTLVHVRNAINALKNEYGVEAEDPVFKQFMTFREGTSNKFHLFVVFNKGGHFIGANAYGRIGYAPKIVTIATGSEDSVMLAVKRKITAKVAKGYKVQH